MDTATPEQKAAMARAAPPTSEDDGGSMTIDQVEQFVENPLRTILPSALRAETPLLFKLDMAIFTTDDEIGFITSDAPCVWFDPEGYKRPPIYRAPGLMHRTIEITLPLSPWRCLYLNRQGIAGYHAVSMNVVDDINRRVRFSADDGFVVRKEFINQHWFDPGSVPDDSWEKTHQKKTGNP